MHAVTLRCLASAALVIALSGCTGTPQAAPVDMADGFATDPAAESPLTKYENGTLTFADPADDGYAKVTDLPLEPVASDPTPVPGPDTVLKGMTPMRASSGGELLASAARIDQAPAPGSAPTARDGKHRNDLGELVTLDESAATACGNVEIAVRSLDAGDRAAATQHLRTASAAARESGVVNGWAERLAQVDLNQDVAPLVGFLRACTIGGYEL